MLVIELNQLMLAVGGLEMQIRIIDDGCGAGRKKGRRSCFDGSRLRPAVIFCGGQPVFRRSFTQTMRIAGPLLKTGL